MPVSSRRGRAHLCIGLGEVWGWGANPWHVGYGRMGIPWGILGGILALVRCQKPQCVKQSMHLERAGLFVHCSPHACAQFAQCVFRGRSLVGLTFVGGG